MPFLCALGVFAFVVCFERPAHAQDHPWCIYKNYGDGDGSCAVSSIVESQGSSGINYAVPS